MSSFKLEWKPSLKHDLKHINKSQIPGIIKSIENLGTNPYPPQSQKLTNALMTYRLRVGDYRVIYQVDQTQKIVSVYHIRHRKDAYRRR